MPKTETKRRIGKKDLAVYSRGQAKEGGRLDKAGQSLNVPKKARPTPAEPKKRPTEGPATSPQHLLPDSGLLGEAKEAIKKKRKRESDY